MRVELVALPNPSRNGRGTIDSGLPLANRRASSLDGRRVRRLTSESQLPHTTPKGAATNWRTMVTSLTRRILFISMLFVAVSLLSCTRNVKETSFTREDALFDMIIASDATEFKDAIRSKIIEKYRDRGNIEIVNIDHLEDIRPGEYDVVLIMDTCMAWSGFNPSLTAFLEDNQHKDNVVLFMTAGDPDWTYSYQGVDAITSASEMENEEPKFHEITRQIDRLVRP